MPKISFDHTSNQEPDKVFSVIKEFLNNPDEIKKFDASLKCDFDESSRSAKIKGSQFKGDFKVEPLSSGSKVSVLLDIPLLLLPLKGKIQETLTRKLTKYLS